MTKTSGSVFSGLLSSVGRKVDTVTPDVSQRLRLSGRGTRIPIQQLPFEVELGEERLRLDPDLALDHRAVRKPLNFVVFNPDRHAQGRRYQLPLKPGDKLEISHHNQEHRLFFESPKEAFRRHFQVSHEGDALVFRDAISELGTYVTLLDGSELEPALSKRRESLYKIIQIYNQTIQPLPFDEAMTTIKSVNELMASEPNREKTFDGSPGGVLKLPAGITLLVVGDIHANIDNLLKILSENALIEELHNGTAVVVFLGDLAHPDFGELDDMESSVTTMDLVFKLKLRFPSQIFILMGNHESFSEDVAKGTVPQGVVWSRYLTSLRGEAYLMEMARFYDQLPIVAISDKLVACHAGPPRRKVSLQDLVDIRRYPNLINELVWNRVRDRRNPYGYTAADVRRFRKSLGVDTNTPFIVGHYPHSPEGALWRDVGGIENHHILMSCKQDEIGLFVSIQDSLVPQIYLAEPLVDWVNARIRPAPPH